MRGFFHFGAHGNSAVGFVIVIILAIVLLKFIGWIFKE